MTLKHGRDYMYLVWKEPKSRKQYVVGELSKNGQYEFSYGYEVKNAIRDGFKLLIAFDNLEKVYKSELLFPAFLSRLPDKKRKDIKKILNKYGLKEYNEYLLLKRSGAQLPIDTLKFIDPLTESGFRIEKTFDLAGVRHYLGCDGNTCEMSAKLNEGERLDLVFETDNPYDSEAVKVLNQKGDVIGYIPRYYNRELKELLGKGYTYSCKVHSYEKDNNCEECIKVDLELTKPGPNNALLVKN